jgi:hypothetical protein
MPGVPGVPKVPGVRECLAKVPTRFGTLVTQGIAMHLRRRTHT